VQTWNLAGYGPWSQVFTFTIQAAVPGAITLISPSALNAQAPGTVRYTWQADAAATWYELYVVQNGTVFKDKWFTLTDSVGAAGSFGVDVDGHSRGTYQWWVRGWSPDGLGPWSGPMSFEVITVY
jgi:hypothetical protein